MSAQKWQGITKGLLANFSVKFGNGPSNPKVYLVSRTKTVGNPIDPPVVVESLLELTNAAFTSVDNSLIDGDVILSTDVFIVCDADHPVTQGDTVRRDGSDYMVIQVDVANPFGEAINQKIVARKR